MRRLCSSPLRKAFIPDPEKTFQDEDGGVDMEQEPTDSSAFDVPAHAFFSPTVFASPSAEGLLFEWLLKANGSPWQHNHLLNESKAFREL